MYRFISHDTTTLDARVSAWANATNSDVSDYRLDRVDPEDTGPAATSNITNTAIRDIPIDIAQNFQEPPASWDSGTPPTPQAPDLVQQLDLSTSPTSLSGRWYVVNHNTGEIVHDFTLPTSANRHYAEQQAAVWQRMTGFDDPIRVYAAD